MAEEKEIWKDIEGYEGLYQVSNLGNVKSLEHYKKSKHNSLSKCKEMIRKQRTYKSGYKYVGLNKNHFQTNYLIHRLVAKAFIPNPNNLPIVNHKDEDKTNNRVENLEWCTYKYNNNYGTCRIRSSIKQMNRNDCSKPINQYSLEGELINTFPSSREIERQLGYCSGSIRKCCIGLMKNAFGYIWKHKEAV